MKSRWLRVAAPLLAGVALFASSTAAFAGVASANVPIVTIAHVIAAITLTYRIGPSYPAAAGLWQCGRRQDRAERQPRGGHRAVCGWLYVATVRGERPWSATPQIGLDRRLSLGCPHRRAGTASHRTPPVHRHLGASP